ncbi:MAG: T9SS type A sorting domain-containing protein [Bacteroidota bacterium]|nr:T9SS type A sorting domain-containing protein [Bacteroidota bacterium]
MKLISTLFEKKTLTTLAAALLMFSATTSFGQVSLVCTSPTSTIYGLDGNGEIYPIKTANAKTGTIVKNSTYPGQTPASANGIGYNTFNGKFYYFKRNTTSAPQEFVSFDPTLNVVTTLANSTATDDIHTGCINFNGTGYYTTDIQGTLSYYNIATNTWTLITSKIVDQGGNNISTLIKTQSAGDMAIDGLGNIWLLTSSSANYGLYKIPAPLPTTPVAQLNVIRIINPTATTPTGNSFAGIAFGTSGQMYMSTKNDNRLYVMTTINALTFIGIFDKSDVGNDLTSCSFPTSILPVTWESFDVSVQNNNNVTLNWDVIEYQDKGFYVQHSMNGTDWEDLAFIPAKNNSESVQSYSYSHINNLNGKQYYRIKQVDLDDRSSFSEVRTITLKNDQQNITVFPNPATDHIRIVGNSSNDNLAKAQIFDLSGKMLIEQKLLTGSNTISINKLPVGAYIVRVESNNGTAYNQKIIKQ